MASRASIQARHRSTDGARRDEVVAVPLFVSSHSSVITSTEFLLGLRKDPPPDLALFAKMNHSPASAAAGASRRTRRAAADPASPVTSARVAFDVRVQSPSVDRADRRRPRRSISTSPAGEAVILVAHGPVPDDDNRRWLDDLAVLAGHVRAAAPFAAVDYMTVRDDAGPAIKDAATRDLRAKVEAQRAAGRRVLIVPHLMSFGGIEQGLRKRLEGLDYTMTAQALMPDERIVQWVLESAR